MKGCGFFLIFLIVFGGVGCGMIYFGYQAKPTDLTDDGYSLKYFLYIMGGGFIAVPLVIQFFVILSGIAGKMGDAHFDRHGVSGIATLISAEDTGTRINDNPLVKLNLRIQLPNQSPYSVETTQTVSIIHVGRLVPNSIIPVTVDSKNLKNVRIDWSKPI